MSNSNSIKTLSGGPLRSNVPGLYVIVVEMEIAGATITSTVPTNAGQITVANTGTGTYSITFAEDLKPRRVISGQVVIEEAQAETHGKWTGYTASTGVGTFTMFGDTVAAGTEAAENFTGTAQLVLYCSKTERADV